MESEIAADGPVDCVIFRIVPENRYEACLSSSKKEEVVGHGPLEQLLEHLPSLKDQIAQGYLDNFRLEIPDITDHRWFTKATLTRFLNIIGSSDLKKAIAIGNEMCQLEEAKKFHLSLYTQAEGITSSDTSKNELVRAMDSRLAALTEELASAINLSAGAAVSFQEMMDLHFFCEHFGDVNIRNLISKLSERSQKRQRDASLDKSKPSIPFVSKNDYVSKSAGHIQVSNAVKAVKYNASPAKAAEIERQSFTDSDDSSFSSEDDQAPAERSRTLIRSASPRRSASPMRKIQIGRSGSRRTPALAIRSLPYFPPRERISSHKDAKDDSDPEVEEPNKKTEVNVTRMSVQAAISLFERKQSDDTVDSQKKSMNDTSVNLSKAVLRRWSSGMGESQRSLAESTTENATSENKVKSEEDVHNHAEAIPDTGRACESPEADNTMEDEMRSKGNNKLELDLNVDDGQLCQTDDSSENLDSVEWSRQKEAELNQMLMKFAQYNLSNQKNAESETNKNLSSRLLQKGGINGPRKEGRDETLKRETIRKKVEKQADLRTKKRVLDKPKAEKSSPKVSDIGKKNTTRRTSNVNTASRTPNVNTTSKTPKVNTTSRALNANKSSQVSSNSKKESPKPDVVKKAPSKPSPVPAIRKSWPSTASPRPLGAISAKTLTGSPSTTPAPRQKAQPPALRQKPQSPASVSRSSPKVEKPQPQQKILKKAPVDTKKNSRKVDDGKSRIPSINGKSTKTKPAMTPNEDATVSPVKALRKKVTKKSSVVPLEAKPPSRKVSGNTPVSSPAKKTEISTQAEQTLSKSEIPISMPDTIGTISADTIDPSLEPVEEKESGPAVLEQETELEIENTKNCDEQDISIEAHVQDDEPAGKLLESPAEIQSPPERVISPAAWEESNQQDPTVPIGNSSSPSPVNHDVVASSGTRVRHSLSQMLLEETSEPDIIEWGNAENPPAMIYQKDAPKGLKRLLKFTRKNKGETNGATWASPYTSEGEEDGEEYRSLGKRTDNLLKVALHSKNHGEGFLSDSEPLSARSNASNSSARSSSKFQDGHSSKGTRSFFSLSAFRGNKS